MQLDDVLADLSAENADLDLLVGRLPADGWAKPTPAEGWTIAHQIAHLAWTDEASRLAAAEPDEFKVELQKLADETGLTLQVCHYPPGTSKWNKIEHRLFCHITKNWRGRPLRTFETVVELIGYTATEAGLRVKARLDKRAYPTGRQVTKAEMRTLALHPHTFHGDWNYELRPRPS